MPRQSKKAMEGSSQPKPTQRDEIHPRESRQGNQGQGQFAAFREAAFKLANEIEISQPLVMTADELPPLIAASHERKYDVIDRWLSHRLAEIKTHWKNVLQVPNHRVMDVRRLRMYHRASELREQKKWSWARLAREVDPSGFRKDQRTAIERLRKGVDAVRKRPRGNINPIFYVPVAFAHRIMPDAALKPFVEPNPGWARKKLKQVKFQKEILLERANFKPKTLLKNAWLDYLCSVDNLATLRTPRTRKLNDLLKSEPMRAYLSLRAVIEESPKDKAAAEKIIWEEMLSVGSCLMHLPQYRDFFTRTEVE